MCVCGPHHESHASTLVAPPPLCPSNQVRKVQYLSADEYKCVCFYQRRGPCGAGGPQPAPTMPGEAEDWRAGREGRGRGMLASISHGGQSN